MAELAGHWAAGTPMAETPWLDDAAQAAQRYEEAAAVDTAEHAAAGQRGSAVCPDARLTSQPQITNGHMPA